MNDQQTFGTSRLRICRGLEIDLVEDGARFAALEEEWEELYRHCPAATPFQSWAWLYSWWEHYGGDYELRLVTVRNEDGLLVGLLPLMLERGGLLRRLLFVGSGITDYLDVLVREGWEREVARAGSLALGRVGSWRVADLQMLRPEAAAWTMLKDWTGPRTSVWQSNCSVVEARPWEELLTSLSKNHRSTVRRTLRRVEADGLSREFAGPEGAEEAGRRLVAVSREQWQQRWMETGPEHWTRRFEEHIATAVRRMTTSGLGGVSELKLGETTVVSTFLVFGRDFVGSYMIGASQQALKRYQWSSLYIWDGLKIAIDRNSSRFDLLRGEEEYKLRWTSEVVANRRLILGRGPIFWAPYAGYRTLRSRAKRYVQQEKTPRWIKDAKNTHHKLHQGAARAWRRIKGLV
jgi:CelD/BcsL family acetyltransferase involved in cellulose biosynthesis